MIEAHFKNIVLFSLQLNNVIYIHLGVNDIYILQISSTIKTQVSITSFYLKCMCRVLLGLGEEKGRMVLKFEVRSCSTTENFQIFFMDAEL